MILYYIGLPRWLSGNAGDAEDVHLIPGPGRSPGGGSGNPLQNSCKENLMDIGALQAPVHGVPKSWTGLSDWAMPGKFSMGTGLFKGSENGLKLERGVVIHMVNTLTVIWLLTLFF